MRKCFALLVTLIFSLIALPSASYAAATPNGKIGLNHAYPKSNGSFAVVVGDVPGVHLALYVNDKNPVQATVNTKGWATFRGVKLPAGSGKISFGRIFHTDGKTYQIPLRYVRYFS